MATVQGAKKVPLKTIVIAVLGLYVSVGTALRAQGTTEVKDDLFAGTEKFAQGATGVNEITMDPDTLGLVNGDRARRAHGMVLNVVRTYEYEKPGMYRLEDVEAFRRKLETGDWHCSVHTRDLKRGDSTDVCNRRRTDGLVETAIITVAPKSLTFIHTVRKPGDDHSHEGLPALSGFGFGPATPALAELAMLGPMLDGQVAGWGTVGAASQAGMAARMAVLGAQLNSQLNTQLNFQLNPELEVRRAELRARMGTDSMRLYTLPPHATPAPAMPDVPRPPE